MPKIFLYGGCVIRDAYELIKNDVELTGYVARQSLISAMNPPVQEAGEINLESAFQTRMASGDLQSNLVKRIRQARDRGTDLFVFDFHIERVNVQRLPDGSFFTPSTELNNAGVLSKLRRRSKSIPLGSDRHTAFWKVAARRLSDRLDRMGIKGRVLVVNAPWARFDNQGKPFTDFQGKPIGEVSDQITALTRLLKAHDIEVIDLPMDLAIGDSNHKWARAPFHFTPGAMRWVADQMLARLP